MAFGGMLGSTFTFVFEMQMENLQDADRFYYLSRVQGLNLLNELENNSFAELVMRNTDLGDDGLDRAARATSSPRPTMPTLEMDISRSSSAPIRPGTTRSSSALSPSWWSATMPTATAIAEYIRVQRQRALVIGGTDERRHDRRRRRRRRDLGHGGNDTHRGRLRRRQGPWRRRRRHHHQRRHRHRRGRLPARRRRQRRHPRRLGPGADLRQRRATTSSSPARTARRPSAAPATTSSSAATGGDFLLGNEGDDWIEGGQRFDTLAGENSELFFNSTIIGHDVLNGGSGDTDYDGESGDDIMFQARRHPAQRTAWPASTGRSTRATAEAANSDLGIPIFDNQEAFILRDRFDLVEGLSGWKHNDILTGRSRGREHAGRGDRHGRHPGSELAARLLLQRPACRRTSRSSTASTNWWRTASVSRSVDAQGQPVLDENGNPELIVLDTSDASDIILGGGGSDTIKGFAGNDIIDGDKWLNVRIRIVKDGVTYTADGMTGKVYLRVATMPTALR